MGYIANENKFRWVNGLSGEVPVHLKAYAHNFFKRLCPELNFDGLKRYPWTQTLLQ